MVRKPAKYLYHKFMFKFEIVVVKICWKMRREIPLLQGLMDFMFRPSLSPVPLQRKNQKALLLLHCKCHLYRANGRYQGRTTY